MREVDYIIVGCGLAGVSFAEELRKHNKSFVVFDDQSQKASIVAAGLYNPVILKRFTSVWKAEEQLIIARGFYKDLECLLGVKLDYQMSVFRKLASIEEQNEWFAAADKPGLESYIVPEIIKNDNSALDAPYGFGKVISTGRIDTYSLFTHYKLFLKMNNAYKCDTFDPAKIRFESDHVIYGDIRASHIVFAEGFGMVSNPYFDKLPLNVAKGEVIIIKAPNLKMDFILKSSVFIVPLEDDLYAVGSTYNWDDQTQIPTVAGKEELLGKLNGLIDADYEIVHHLAGIRPTVKDRKPLVGVHDNYKQLAIINGLGTRGVMIGPYVAQQLYNHLEENTVLDKEIDIKRFNK